MTVHPVYRDIGNRSRFAVRLDLPGEYVDKRAAAADGFAIAHRFFRGKYTVSRFEQSKTVRQYHVAAHARFRIDCHAWEPLVTIRSERAQNKGVVQTFDGGDSPFVERTFRSPEAAARFGLDYGERVVLGLVGGLRI